MLYDSIQFSHSKTPVASAKKYAVGFAQAPRGAGSALTGAMVASLPAGTAGAVGVSSKASAGATLRTMAFGRGAAAVSAGTATAISGAAQPEGRNFGQSGLSFLGLWRQYEISKSRQKTENLNIEKYNIPNFHKVSGDCYRGETLSSKRNRKYIAPIKDSGIENIIDLRDKYSSEAYAEMCKNAGLKYYHIPVDSFSVSDNEIIQNLPLLFKVLDEGKVYIACAQGLHRTDIALAVDYVFNPKEKGAPVMYGHFREYGFKSDDIIRRINSLSKSLTDNDIKNLGWESVEDARKTFSERKANFVSYNRFMAEKYSNPEGI